MIKQNTEYQNKKEINYWQHQSPYIFYYRHTLKLSYIINLITDVNLEGNDQSGLINLYRASVMKLIKSLYDGKYIQNYAACQKIIKQMFYVGNNNTDELNEIIEVCRVTHPMDRNMPHVYMENLAKQYEAVIITTFGKLYMKYIKLFCRFLITMNTNGFIVRVNNQSCIQEFMSLSDFCQEIIAVISKYNSVLDFNNNEWGQINIELVEKRIQESEMVQELKILLDSIIQNTSINTFQNDINNIILKIKTTCSKLIVLCSSDSGQALNNDVLASLYITVNRNQESIQNMQKFLLHQYKPDDQES